MTIDVNTILTKFSVELHDENAVRWTQPRALSWLLEGLQAITRIRPDMVSVTETVTLSPGAKQTLPFGGVTLISAVRNKGASGSESGPGITNVASLDVMNRAGTSWMTDTASATVRQVVPGMRRGEYFVWPPQPSIPTKIEIVYAKEPEAPLAGGTIPVPTDLEPVLLAWMLYRAYGQEGELQELGRSDRHFKVFQEMIAR